MRGLAIQDELRDIGQDDGVAAGNAPEGDHLGEVAEEAIDGGCIAEVVDGREKFGGNGLSGAVAPEEFLSVMGAKVCRQLGQVTISAIKARTESLFGWSNEHAAAVAPCVDMLAAVEIIGARERLKAGVWHGKCAHRGYPPSFFARM